MSCVNVQELFCWFMDHRLTKPDQDNWISFRNAITVWIDCWFHGKKPDFQFPDDDSLEVFVDGQKIIALAYQPDNEYNLKIGCIDTDDNQWEEDSYALRLYDTD